LELDKNGEDEFYYGFVLFWTVLVKMVKESYWVVNLNIK